jgi:YesN/AraC family two-component response regulator
MKPLQGNMYGFRLLYVEDEADTRDLLSRIIAKNYPDLKLFFAENGATGLEVFREQRPDIVLTDLYMPVMDGIQMAREIKALDAEMVIIAVTAHNDPHYLLDAIEIGIRHYVLKPVISENLFAVINKTIEELNLKRLVSEQEWQIRKREQQLARAQKITHLGCWEWDIDSGKTSWSDEPDIRP